MTSTSRAVRNTRNGNYASDVPDGEAMPAWDLDAIGRGYDAAKANIADGVGALTAGDVSDPWPETEAIDVRLITPPAPAARYAPETPAATGRAWRVLRRWIARRSDATP